MSARSAGTLILGLLLIAAGALFLAVNLGDIDVGWMVIFKILFPALFIYIGSSKLIRHFMWDRDEIQKRPGKAGLLGGLFWLSLGLIILLDILDVLVTLEVIGTYWPVILIVFGLLKIIDYYRFQGALQFRTGEIFGLVFLIFFGLASSQLAKAHLGLFDELRLGGFRWPVLYPSDENKFQFDSSETIEAANLESLELTNLYGNLNVLTGNSETITIQLSKVVRSETEEEAKSIADAVKVITKKEDGLLRIMTNREELQERGKKLNTHITVQLPEKVNITLKNRYGDIELDRRTADCKIENSYGHVRAQSVTGELEIVNRYRPVEVKRIQGKLKITNRRGSVRAEEVNGDSEISTDYDSITANVIEGNLILRNNFGSIRVEDVKGTLSIEGPGSRIDVNRVTEPVSIKNSHKTVTVKDLKGELDLETSYSNVNLEQIQGLATLALTNSDITAKELSSGIQIEGKGSGISLAEAKGQIDVVTTLRRVKVEQFSGAVNIKNEYGDIVLTSKTTPTQPVTAENTNGDIELTLPKSSSFQLAAQSYSGEINTDFGEAKPDSNGSDSSLNTQVGTGGPKIELKTSHSRIRIKKRG